jgi:hypothetical protein
MMEVVAVSQLPILLLWFAATGVGRGKKQTVRRVEASGPVAFDGCSGLDRDPRARARIRWVHVGPGPG